MSLPPGLLPIARQLHAALQVEIDHEIQIERLVSDGLYARDVLLVCDACPGTGLPGLAAQFRALVPEPAADAHLDEAPAMDVPHSMAMRAMAAAWAVDSAPMAAEHLAAAPAGPGGSARNAPGAASNSAPYAANPVAPRAPLRPAHAGPARQAPAGAGAWLQRWWGRWRSR